MWKYWNADYDSKRYKYGIYNLDRLAITCTNAKIPNIYLEFLGSINYHNFEIIKRNSIILDGLTCELQIMESYKTLKWNLDREMNSDLEKFINKLRSWRNEIANQ
jgi:hypothetical protein